MKGLVDVQYADDRPALPAPKAALEDFGMGLLTTKSSHWSFEEEVRLIAHPSRGKLNGRDLRGFDILLFRFPRECVREIVLGSQVSEDLRDSLVQIAKNDYERAAFLEAFIDRDKYELGFRSGVR